MKFQSIRKYHLTRLLVAAVGLGPYQLRSAVGHISKRDQ